jgi:sulfhydrogenase subunit beta (sulfur reductase)
VTFEKVEDVTKIYLERNTDFPLKEFFFRKREKLFSFRKDKIHVELDKPKRTRVFFGIRRCDLNAVRHQDFIFMQKYKDPYYTAQREGAILMGYHCNSAPSKYCFCGSMDLVDYYDLMFFDKKDYFLVHAGSDKGKKLIEKKGFIKEERQLTEKDRKIDYAHRLKNKNIKDLYDNAGWKKGVDRCISCAACTTLCPTCYCHEIKDEVSIEDLQKGERIREWSSCQLKAFTRVAQDHVFRDKREDRFKHRIYHQLQYFKERYNREMCVGCGRCITYCPTEIDFVDIINEMSGKK